ncbi:MAG: trypsin-like peptidase domain-containing protein [Pyrinomonadaceae bacterium]
MFAHLTRELVAEIRNVFTEFNLSYDLEWRPILLHGINRQFVGWLQNFKSDLTQLSGDLNAMNSVERLADGTIPLQIWLRNAVEQLSHIDKTKVFSRALDELNNRMSTAGPISEPAKIPELFEVREALVHRNDMVAYGFLSAGFDAGKSVARLSVLRHDGSNASEIATGQPEIHRGTGWLVAPDLVMTNHHVVNARRDGQSDASATDLELQARNTSVQFDFDAETLGGVSLNAAKLEAFDKELDYAVLRLESPVDRTPLPISPDKVTVTPDSYLSVNIIQHPNGGPKKVALRNNLVYDSEFPRLRYFTDTEHGSSGSPVFSDSWKVIALHRASTFVGNVKFQGRLTGWVNEGTQMAAILENLKAKNIDLYRTITGG